MNKTKIEWVVNPDGSPGYTWNPVTGCEHGCPYCYAEKISMRFQGNFKPRIHENRLRQPAGIEKPSTIFVCSMADLFGKWVPHEWIDNVLKTVRECPQHTFLFLTKNPKRYRLFNFPDNCWLGITVTDNESFWKNETMLKPHGFISFEPLLEGIKLDLLAYMLSMGDVNWIIIGSLNAGNGPVPTNRGGTHREWVTELIKEAHGIPVFVKDSLYELYPDLPRLRGLPYLKDRSEKERGN